MAVVCSQARPATVETMADALEILRAAFQRTSYAVHPLNTQAAELFVRFSLPAESARNVPLVSCHEVPGNGSPCPPLGDIRRGQIHSEWVSLEISRFHDRCNAPGHRWAQRLCLQRTPTGASPFAKHITGGPAGCYGRAINGRGFANGGVTVDEIQITGQGDIFGYTPAFAKATEGVYW